MSKDKGSKNTKKAPDKSAGKHISDYKAENKRSNNKNTPMPAFDPKPDNPSGGSHKPK